MDLGIGARAQVHRADIGRRRIERIERHRCRGFAHGIHTGVAHHADDLGVWLVIPEALANRIAAFEILPRRGFVDDGDPGVAADLALLEIAAGDDRHPDGREVVGADTVLLQDHLLAGLAHVALIAGRRRPIGIRSSARTSRSSPTPRRAALRPASISADTAPAIPEARSHRRRADRHPEHARLESQGQRRQVAKAPRKQPGTDGEQQRQGDLRDDEDLREAQPRAMRSAAAARLEGVLNDRSVARHAGAKPNSMLVSSVMIAVKASTRVSMPTEKGSGP